MKKNTKHKIYKKKIPVNSRRKTREELAKTQAF